MINAVCVIIRIGGYIQIALIIGGIIVGLMVVEFLEKIFDYLVDVMEGQKMNNIILFILYLIFVLLIVAGFGIIIHKALQLLLMFLVELFSFDEKGDE